jgi:hypothetical protein
MLRAERGVYTCLRFWRVIDEEKQAEGTSGSIQFILSKGKQTDKLNSDIL